MIRQSLGKRLVSGLEFAERLPLIGKSIADFTHRFGHRFLESGTYGAYLLRSRKPAEAETRFRKALEICVSDAEAIAGLTVALRDQNRANEIIHELIQLAQKIPNRKVVKCLPFPVELTKVLLDDPALMDQMRQHVSQYPGAFSATLLLAFAEAEGGNIELSIQLFDALAAEFFQGKEDPAAPKAKPRFLILGQNKAATTALFGHISSHPMMVKPLRKEPNFWSQNYNYGLDWYESQFPRLSNESQKFTGESSTSYLLHRVAPSRVHAELPEVKLIALLRDPVSRAYSEYCMKQKSNDPNQGFSEIARLIMKEHSTCPIDDALISRKDGRSVFTHSIALPGLKRWLEYFPAKQLLVLHQEDLLRDLPGILRRVCNFLDVPYFVSNSPKMLHTGRYPPLNEALREELKDWYAPHEEALQSFLASLPGYHR